MNLLVRSLSGNPSSGSSGSGSPSSPTAPPRTGTRSKRSSRSSRHNHPPLFSSHSSPGDYSPTSSQLPTRRTATSWSDATRMVYDLEADSTNYTRPRRSGGFDDYVPDSEPPSSGVHDFDYFEYFSNYNRGLSAPPKDVSPPADYRWQEPRTQEDSRSCYASRPRNSATAEDDHRTLNNGFRRLWRRSSRDTPTFRVTPPGVLASSSTSSLSPSVQIPMNSSRPRHSLIIENEDEDLVDETILASSLPPSSSLSQHRSYDHHPSSSASFSPPHHHHQRGGGITNRHSSFSSPATTHLHHQQQQQHPSPIFPRKLSAANLPSSSRHRPSVMFHPSSSSMAATFGDGGERSGEGEELESRRAFYYDDANDVTNDHQTIQRHSSPHRSGSLFDPRGSSARYGMDGQIRRASAAPTSGSDGSSAWSAPTAVGVAVAVGGQRPNNINNSSPWNPFRISFIETSAYTPQDIPDTSNSPDSEFIPFPTIQPHSKFQKQLHGEWVNETVGELRKWFKSPTTQILVNVESKSKYPFIIFGSLGPSFDASGFVPSSATEPLSSELRINDGIYNVCGSVSRPAPSSASVAGGNHHLQLDPDATPHGYVVTAFQTFPGEDSERLERNWITWTGAQVLYKYLPITVGLRNIIFYKRHDLHLLKSRKTIQCPPAMQQQQSLDSEDVSSPELEQVRGVRSSSDGTPLISYVLLCECLTLSESILTSTCAVIDQLRARCCGYSALYINYGLTAGSSSTDHRHHINPQQHQRQVHQRDDHELQQEQLLMTSSQFPLPSLPPHYSRPSNLHIS